MNNELADKIRAMSPDMREVVEAAGLMGMAVAKIGFMSDAEKAAFVAYMCDPRYGLEPPQAAALRLFVDTVHEPD